MSKQKAKYVEKIRTGILGLNGLLNNSWDETVAAIYVIANLSIRKPEIGQQIVCALKPLIKLWRKERYGVRDEMQREEIQRWIRFWDRFVRQKKYLQSSPRTIKTNE